jgi:uncharacterized membrane protein (DUF373 family)
MDIESMHETIQNEVSSARRRIGLTLSLVEQIVYVGLGTVLAICALASLAGAFKNIAYCLWHRDLIGQIVGVLDQLLLVLLIIELLYTVQVSLREHRLVVEPFLVVALVSAIRRILIITAEMTKLPPSSQLIFQRAMLELGVLSVMIVILVGSLILLQRSASAGDRGELV